MKYIVRNKKTKEAYAEFCPYDGFMEVVWFDNEEIAKKYCKSNSWEVRNVEAIAKNKTQKKFLEEWSVEESKLSYKLFFRFFKKRNEKLKEMIYSKWYSFFYSEEYPICSNKDRAEKYYLARFN